MKKAGSGFPIGIEIFDFCLHSVSFGFDNGTSMTSEFVRAVSINNKLGRIKIDLRDNPDNLPCGLNLTEATADISTRWNDTAPTSSVFSVSTSTEVNDNSVGMITYLWRGVQGYSKFGSFVSNGNADGTFCYLGFRAAFFMYKRVDAAAHWTFHTNKIDGYNEVTKSINANEDNAESTSTGDNDIDICASGVKLREDNTHINASGASYIYIAFAEFPFVSSNGKAGVAR